MLELCGYITKQMHDSLQCTHIEADQQLYELLYLRWGREQNQGMARAQPWVQDSR